ncbi:hypothetical protein DFH09DRAFT_1074735 [Mycena vulgaris]|nr:hypothetical protein DFH09DRAFT_1074735 [Mycena vulgaris]
MQRPPDPSLFCALLLPLSLPLFRNSGLTLIQRLIPISLAIVCIPRIYDSAARGSNRVQRGPAQVRFRFNGDSEPDRGDLWDIIETEDMSDPPDINVDSATTHDLRGLGSSAILLSSVRSFYIEYFLEDTDLGLCLPGESVFPNLEKLHWSPRKPPEGFHHVRMFLTPRIKILRLGPITTISHLSVLSTLAVKCPSLKEVDITVDEIEYEALPMISTFVRGLRCITSLDVPGLDDSALAGYQCTQYPVDI